MKKPISILLLILFVFACNKPDKPKPPKPDPPNSEIDNSQGGDNNPPVEIPDENDTVSIDLVVELPEEASQKLEELDVQSLYGTSNISANGSSKIEVLNGANFEINVVMGITGEILLMGFIDPKNDGTQKLDAESTAKAMTLLHPWAIGLTKSGKQAFMDYIITLPEYSDLVAQIESGISSGSLAEVNLEPIFKKTLHSDKSSKEVYAFFMPLHITADNQKVMVSNESNIAYGLGLYKDNSRVTSGLVLGGTKSQSTIDQIRSGLFNSTNSDEIDIALENDGLYELRARSGLFLDSEPEHQAALDQNLAVVLYEMFGLFTGGAKSIFKNTTCFFDVLDQVKATRDFEIDYKLYSAGNISGFKFAHTILVAFKDVITQTQVALFKSCLKKEDAAAFIKVVFGVLDFYAKANAVINASSIVNDWNTQEREINTCLEKSGEAYSFCNGLKIVSDFDFDFGQVPVGKEITGKITMTNQIDSEVDVFTISVPQPFKTDWDKTNFVLNYQQSEDFNISFNSDDVKPYSADLVIDNNIDQISGTLTIKAEVVNALKFESTLDFGKVLVNQKSELRTMTIANESDVDILLNASEPIDGYEFNWSEQTIEARKSFNTQIRFTPTDENEDYNKILELKNDTGQENISITLKGDGYIGLQLEVLAPHANLDFGKVRKMTEKTRKVRLTNPNDSSIFIKEIYFSQEAEGGYRTSLDSQLQNQDFELTKNQSVDFDVVFNPQGLEDYDGELILKNNVGDEISNNLPVMGEGVDQGLSVAPESIDFGETEISTPSTKTFVITNNLDEAIQIRPLTSTHLEVTTDWSIGGTLNQGQSRTVSATFTPTATTTTINGGSISIETEDGSEAISVSYAGSKKENNEVDLTGTWYLNDNGITCNSGQDYGGPTPMTFYEDGTLEYIAGNTGTYEFDGNTLSLTFGYDLFNLERQCDDGSISFHNQFVDGSFEGSFNGTSFTGTFTYSVNRVPNLDSCNGTSDFSCSGPMTIVN